MAKGDQLTTRLQDCRMNVTEAVRTRTSIRAYRPDPVPAALVRELITLAQLAPSGGNLQPWRVYALAGAPLAALKAQVRAAGFGEKPEYNVYPPNLWDPFRTRRFENGEDLYRTISIPREDRAARLAQLARNGDFFGAPVGLFFCLDRNLGPPQWSDVGMYMQTLMLLATERGLSTCAQEYWANFPTTLAAALALPADHIVFSGMALGYADAAQPINTLRARREPFEAFAEMKGFE
jgi:nitroreductase